MVEYIYRKEFIRMEKRPIKVSKCKNKNCDYIIFGLKDYCDYHHQENIDKNWLKKVVS